MVSSSDPCLAAVAADDNSAWPEVTCLGSLRALRSDIDHRKVPRGTLARKKMPSQGDDKSLS